MAFGMGGSIEIVCEDDDGVGREVNCGGKITLG